MESSLAEWSKLPNNPASQWTSADRLIWEDAAGQLARSADRVEEIGRTSNNSIMEDFLMLSAAYYRAYSKSVPTFAIPDGELYIAGQNAGVAVNAACKAAEA